MKQHRNRWWSRTLDDNQWFGNYACATRDSWMGECSQQDRVRDLTQQKQEHIVNNKWNGYPTIYEMELSKPPKVMKTTRFGRWKSNSCAAGSVGWMGFALFGLRRLVLLLRWLAACLSCSQAWGPQDPSLKCWILVVGQQVVDICDLWYGKTREDHGRPTWSQHWASPHGSMPHLS